MTSVGETLRAARLKRNLGLDQISRELKISSRLLEAIESEQFDKLPGGVFTKSFVRQYARLLGLDDDDLASRVQRVLEPQPEISPVVHQPKPFSIDFHVPKMDQWESIGENRFRMSGSLSAAAFFVVILLICSGVYTWIQRPHPADTGRVFTPAERPAPAPQPAAPVAQPSAQPANPAEADSPAEASDAPPAGRNPPLPSAFPDRQPAASIAKATPANGTPQTPDARRATRSDSNATLSNATLRVDLTADEPVWVLARVDGKYAFSGTLDTHQSRTVESNGTILLRLGNAGGVSISLNGKPLGPVGPKGQVRTLQFTSGGFQIVPVKPPAADPL